MKKKIKKILLIFIFLLSFSLTSCDFLNSINAKTDKTEDNNNNNNNNSSDDENKTKYTVTFNYNYESTDKKVEVVEGEKVLRPTTPTRSGFKFLGWFTDTELNNSYDFNSKVKSSFILYAKWEEIKTNNNNNQNANGDNPSESIDVPSENVDVPPTYTYGFVDNDVAIRTDIEFSKDAHTSANHTEFDCKNISKGQYAVSYNDASTTSTVNGFKFSCYRFGKIGDTVRLLAPGSNYDSTEYHGREGGLFNLTPFGGINKFTITYKASVSSNTNPTNPNIRFGSDDNCLDYVYFLDTTTTAKTVTIDLNLSMYQYFSINSGDYDTYITSFAVDYDNNSKVNNLYEQASGENKVRINPITYNFNLVPGESKITAPIEYEYDAVNDCYNVIATKEFTYYTSDYVSNHSEVYDDAVITDPMEVCIYYTLFKTWPANYSMNTNDIQGIFGTDTRKVSRYNRRDGYCRAIPWNGSGYYYELDIDVDGSYRTSSRGVGRVVVWENGWTQDGYDSAPVCIYTDDHYNTFIEYLNNGDWSNRFNAEGLIASISYSSAQTVTFANFDGNPVDGTGQGQNNNNNNNENNDPVVKQINDEDYYGNYAPAELINNNTALFQKVTNMSGIVEGNSYIIVNEAYQAIYNNYQFLTWNLDDHTISYYNEYELDPKNLTALFLYHFEKVSDNQYYMYSGDSTYYSVPSAKGNLEYSKGIINITFDAYGNLNLYSGNMYLRYNTASGGLFRCYNQGSQQSIQLYRYCDIEGATPPSEDDNPSTVEMVDSNFNIVSSIDNITSTNAYLIINPKNKACLTDLNNSLYEEETYSYFDLYSLKMSKDAQYELLYFVKHEDELSETPYCEIYVIRDNVKYYLTYSEDKNIEYSTELKNYYYISVAQDGTVKLSLGHMNYGYLSHVFDDESWWYLAYDETNSKFIFTKEFNSSTDKLYSTYIQQQEEEMIETNYECVTEEEAITEDDTYIIVSWFDAKCLTDLNDSTYEVVNYLTYMGFNKSKNAQFEELHIKKYNSSIENVLNYCEIYVIRDDVKYYLNFDVQTKDAYFSQTLTTYFSIQFRDNGTMYFLAVELMEVNEKTYPVLIGTENTNCGWFLDYDADNKKFVFIQEQLGVNLCSDIYLFKIVEQ